MNGNGGLSTFTVILPNVIKHSLDDEHEIVISYFVFSVPEDSASEQIGDILRGIKVGYLGGYPVVLWFDFKHSLKPWSAILSML